MIPSDMEVRKATLKDLTHACVYWGFHYRELAPRLT